MSPYLAFPTLEAAYRYDALLHERERQITRDVETAMLVKAFERVDLRVCDELSRTRCTQAGRPLRPWMRGRA